MAMMNEIICKDRRDAVHGRQRAQRTSSVHDTISLR
jgi:hypothetical protein